MKEGNLINALMGRIGKRIHAQSMTFGSMSQNGTPDRYFDGPRRDLWVEFKQLDHMPKTGLAGGITPARDRKKGCYTSQQYDWMLRRHNNGGNVWGMIGLPNKLVVIQKLPKEWKDGSPVSKAFARDIAAEMILDFCLGTPNARTVVDRDYQRDRRAVD